MRRFQLVLLSFAVMTLLATLPAATPAQGPRKLASVEGITEYQFDNGLRLLLFPDPSKPTVTVNLTVFVGSRHEGYGEAGMAHLLEHMLFKGTPTNPQVPKVLQERGARFNGTTWVDRTNYFETLPASDDNLDFALGLEADRMMNSYIKGEDLATEMTVVRNEFESGENNPSRILRQRMTAAAYEWHNYGKSTIGNRSDIERVPIPNLRAFYKKYYQPDNAQVVVAGQFDEKKALAMVAKHFGSLPKPERVLDSTYTEEPAQDGERSVTLRRVGDVGIVGVAYHIPSAAHPDFAAVRILSYILADEPGGRLYKALVETKKASDVSGSAFAWHDPGLMMMLAEVRRENPLDDVRGILQETVEGLSKGGVTDVEVNRARQQILNEREKALANSSQLAVELSEWSAQGDWRLFFIYRDRVEKVTPEDVKQVAAKYLKQSNRTVGLFIPSDQSDRTPVPTNPDIKSLVESYKGREAVAQGEQFESTPENIEARTKRSTLAGASGIKTAYLAKKTRGETVQLQLTLRYGDAENLKGLDSACSFLPQLMTRGTKKLSFQELQDALDKNKATLNAGGERGLLNVSMQTKRSNLPAVIDLVGQVLREPSLPAAEFDVLKRQRLADLEQSRTDPQALAISRLRAMIFPYPKDDVRYRPTVPEQIERAQAATLDEVKRLHAQFLGAQAGELVLVGDFDEAEVGPKLAAIFTGWTAKQSYKRVAEEAFLKVPGTKETILTPDKANAVYVSGLVMPISDSHQDYPAIVMGNFIFGGGSLSSRLGDRVRQKEGLSYGVGSGLRPSTLDDYCTLTVSAIANPENAPKVDAVIKEELDKLLKSGVTADEVARAKKGYLQSQHVQRTSDGQLAGLLGSTLYVDRTMKFYAEQEKQIESLTGEQIVAALRKYVDPKRLVVVTAGDFEAKK